MHVFNVYMVILTMIIQICQKEEEDLFRGCYTTTTNVSQKFKLSK